MTNEIIIPDQIAHTFPKALCKNMYRAFVYYVISKAKYCKLFEFSSLRNYIHMPTGLFYVRIQLPKSVRPVTFIVVIIYTINITANYLNSVFVLYYRTYTIVETNCIFEWRSETHNRGISSFALLGVSSYDDTRSLYSGNDIIQIWRLRETFTNTQIIVIQHTIFLILRFLNNLPHP